MSASPNPQMSPERSPGSLAPGCGVRRANKIPLYLVSGLIAVVALVVAMVANDRAEQQAQMLKSTTGPLQQSKGGGTMALADRIAGSHHAGIIPPAASKPILRPERNQTETPMVGAGSLDAQAQVNAKIVIARPNDLEAPPIPTRAGGVQLVTGQPLARTPTGEEAEALRQAKIQQLQDALKAPSTVSFSLTRSEKPAPILESKTEPALPSDARERLAETTQQVAKAARSDDPTKAYQAQLTQLRQAGLLSPLDGGAEP